MFDGEQKPNNEDDGVTLLDLVSLLAMALAGGILLALFLLGPK